jgi:hypothetical protein
MASIESSMRFAGERGNYLGLAIICIVFVALRLPVILRQIPAQDEDYFAIPGLTILREGIPRIPYMPSRNERGAFYKADEFLFALPPLYFYLEAGLYLLVGPSTGAARGVSLLCGVAAIVGVSALATRLFRSPAAGLWSAGLYAASRVILFPCMIARPDMLCGALGIGVLLAMWRWSLGVSGVGSTVTLAPLPGPPPGTGGGRKVRMHCWLVVAGVAIGLGMLSHPFAMVYAIQAGVWALLVRGSWTQRIGRAALLTAVAIVTFAVWGVLIAQHPEAFRSQFFNNVLNQSGPGLLSRLVWPVKSFSVQVPLFIEYAGPVQAALMTAGLLAIIALAVSRHDAGIRTAAILTASAVYLHVTTVGVHPTKGYWCYTGALLFVCLGGAVAHFLTPSIQPTAESLPEPRLRFRTIATFAAAAAVMLPGAGLRTVVAHIRHWNDVNYDAPRFTQELMNAVPADARLVVDPGYIFDFYRAGRHVTLALDYEFFFSVRGTDYDYVVGGPYSLRDKVPGALNAEFVRSYGNRNDLFACYAELYRSPQPNSEEPRK